MTDPLAITVAMSNALRAYMATIGDHWSGPYTSRIEFFFRLGFGGRPLPQPNRFHGRQGKAQNLTLIKAWEAGRAYALLDWSAE